MGTINRRNVLSTALVGTAAVAVGGLVTGLSNPDSPTGTSAASEAVDEIYQGRRISGNVGAGNFAHGPGHHGVTASIDGHPMHVMQLSDGRYTTQVNHYEHFDTLRDALRAAVDTLGPDAYPISLTDRAVA